MDELFEILPFHSRANSQGEEEWEGEWEGERWRAGGGRYGGGGARVRAPLRGPRRPAPPRYQPRRTPLLLPHAYPFPYLAPRYRGWPATGYGLYPLPAVQDDGQADEPGDAPAGSEGEVPATLAATLARLPEAAALSYRALGPLDAAVRDPHGTGPGLYLIEFDAGGRQRAYSGQTDDLRRRLLQHRLCGQILGIDMRGYRVYVAPLSSPAQRRSIERRIHDDMFATRRGVLTNQRRELELSVLGETWS
ncbi:hypothetical protein [Janthinobacterium sp.]|uniref:hypothetical protein n=1 Tax=Janthinobacterium sp. TaxID=1871054 RepID=UPI00262D3D4B|nr:hypothetical protein [Janthinobacterium sp.]